MSLVIVIPWRFIGVLNFGDDIGSAISVGEGGLGVLNDNIFKTVLSVLEVFLVRHVVVRKMYMYMYRNLCLTAIHQ